ncbi:MULTISPECIES: PspC domain-containing protein [unclassified Geodermatophilus]|uniref:PspC domain-containing protein n=1 Tax=unclassified Geodermatophilus TaxID=2637632 RepID=UPI003EEFA302
MTTAPNPPQHPTWQQPPPRPQLRRSGTDKMLGGVCGGLAEYSGIDALIWRVGFLVLAFSGIGVVAYLALWVLAPPAPAGPDTRTNVADQFVERLHASLTGTRTTAGR